MKIAEFLNHFQGVKKTGNGWLARCPAHDDKQASLSISIGEDGRILLKCFAGCDTEHIIKALGLEWNDLFEGNDSERIHTHTSKGRKYYASGMFGERN